MRETEGDQGRRGSKSSISTRARCVEYVAWATPYIVGLYHVTITSHRARFVRSRVLNIATQISTSLIKHQLLPPSRCVTIARQLLGGLRFIHSHRVAHCNLQPSILLIQGCFFSQSSLKLGGFGWSRTMPADGGDFRRAFVGRLVLLCNRGVAGKQVL